MTQCPSLRVKMKGNLPCSFRGLKYFDEKSVLKVDASNVKRGFMMLTYVKKQ
jgi:hypothetical protein